MKVLIYQWEGLTTDKMLKFNSILLTSLDVLILETLLLIGGIESNPGPNDGDKNDGDDVTLNRSDSVLKRVTYFEKMKARQLQSSSTSSSAHSDHDNLQQEEAPVPDTQSTLESLNLHRQQPQEQPPQKSEHQLQNKQCHPEEIEQIGTKRKSEMIHDLQQKLASTNIDKLKLVGETSRGPQNEEKTQIEDDNSRMQYSQFSNQQEASQSKNKQQKLDKPKIPKKPTTKQISKATEDKHTISPFDSIQNSQYFKQLTVLHQQILQQLQIMKRIHEPEEYEQQNLDDKDSVTHQDELQECSMENINIDNLITYKKLPGAAGMEGQNFEIRVTALLFLRGINHTRGFYMASNLDDVGAFDDIVFSYFNKDAGQQSTWYLQLKYKVKDGVMITRNSLLASKGNFSLRKYFQSYLKVRDMSRDLKGKNPLFSAPRIRFCLYTNGGFQQLSPLVETDEDDYFIFSSGEDSSNEFQFVKDRDKDIFTMFENLKDFQILLHELKRIILNENDFKEIARQKINEFCRICETPDLLSKVEEIKEKLDISEIDKIIKENPSCEDLFLHEDFLQKCNMFTSEGNLSVLYEMILQEIHNALLTSENESRKIAKEVLDEIQKWWEEGDYCLTEKANFWQRILKVRENRARKLCAFKQGQLNELKVKFHPKYVKELGNFIKEDGYYNIIADEGCTLLSCLKTYQTLEHLKIASFIFVNIQTLMTRLNDILSLWPSLWCTTLIVEWDSSYHGNHDEACRAIESILHIKDELKTQTSDDLEMNIHRQRVWHSNVPSYHKEMINELKFKFTPRKMGKFILISPKQITERISFRVFQDNCGLIHLDESSQQHILKRSLKFQGNEVRLESLLDSKYIVSASILMSLLSKNDIIIGDSRSDTPSYYIPRTLLQNKYISKEILKVRESCATLAISGISKHDLEALVLPEDRIFDLSNSNIQQEVPRGIRIICLSGNSPQKSFANLCRKYNDIHWLSMEDGDLMWKESKGNISIVRQHVDETRTSSHHTYSIVNVPGKRVLLAAEPGMGKSTLVSHLISKTKECCPNIWMIEINFLNRIKDLKKDLDVLEFLFKSISTCYPSDAKQLAKQLLRHALAEKGNVAVIIDGFDEVFSKHADKVVRLISSLEKCKLEKIWVTSRPVWRKLLEENMSVISYSLRSLTDLDQKVFLRKFWLRHIPNIDTEFLNESITKVLHLASTYLIDNDKIFTGIPLHTFMLAEVFVGQLENGTLILPEKLNLLNLYDKFVSTKWSIFWNRHNLTREDVWYKFFIKEHMYASLYMLLNEEEFASLKQTDIPETCKEFFLRIEKGEETTGIIDRINCGLPHFVHKTFSEYFAAKWFYYNFESHRELLRNKMFEPSLLVLRRLFERMIVEGYPLHEAILNRDQEMVESLLSEGIEVNSIDKGGRSSLHLVAFGGHCFTDLPSQETETIYRIADLLVGKKASDRIADRIFGWKPLRIAEATESWYIVEMLLQRKADTRDLLRIKTNCRQGRKALSLAAEKGYTKLVEFILKNWARINNPIESSQYVGTKSTLLHIASEFGHVKLVEFLINAGADLYVRDVNGRTPVSVAAKHNELYVVRYLMESQNYILARIPVVRTVFGYINIAEVRDNWGDTALHLASRNGHAEIVHYFIEKGVNINILNDDGNTSLHLAAGAGAVRVVELFLEAGMNFNCVNQYGETPLHLAARADMLEMVKFLVTNEQTDKSLRNKDGETAFDVASTNVRNYLLP